MSVRGFSIFASVLAVGATGVWIWYSNDAAVQPGRGAAEGIAVAEPSRPVPASPVPPVPDASGKEVVSPDAPPAEPIKPPESAPVTSSVSPGMPMLRSGPSASRVRAAGGPNGDSPAPPPEREGAAKAELAKVHAMLRDYRTRIGENPVGSNAEIMKAVMGANPAGAKLGPPPGQEVNEAGELLDAWGTPLFFHQLSKTSMEVHSAGPDRKMWTTDDLITK